MRIVEYKKSSNEPFEKYVDIGVTERHHDFICYYRNDKQTYSEWYNEFLKEPIGSQLLTINFYLYELNKKGLSIESFKEIYGNKIYQVIFSNYNRLNDINEKWFDDPNFFKGIDLAWDDLSDFIASMVQKDDGAISEIKFNDGGIMRFLDDDDSFDSFFVLEEEYPELESEVLDIVRKFK